MTTQRDVRAAVPLRPVTPMDVVTARLAELVRWVADGDLVVDPAVMAELRDLSALAGGLQAYVEQCSTPASPALRALAERTRTHDWTAHRNGPGLEPEMLSGHVEGKVLQMLVHATRARRVLEIGMFTGYAALAMAEALPAGGSVITCEIDPQVATLADEQLARSPAGARVDVRIGPARDTLVALAADGLCFDVIFLDADKAGYVDYFRAVLDLGLLSEHGLLCVDNTMMQGEPWTGVRTPNGAAIARFNDVVAADPRVEQVMVPLRDGLSLVRLIGVRR